MFIDVFDLLIKSRMQNQKSCIAIISPAMYMSGAAN
jgi:hypothetical protein